MLQTSNFLMVKHMFLVFRKLKHSFETRMEQGSLTATCMVGLSACGGGAASNASPISTPAPVATLAPAPETGRAFFVSPTGSDTINDGSLERPWNTIQYGVDQLVAGDILTVTPGVYMERVALRGTGDSGDDGAPLTILGQAGAIIDGSNMTPNGEDALLTLDDVNNVIIDGLEIRNFKTPFGFRINNVPIGILVTGTSNQIEINNNIVTGMENNSTCTQNDNCGPGANGIAVYGRSVNGITNISFTNNEVAFNKTASSEAFVLNGNVNGFSVIGNYIHDNNNIGLDFIGLEGQCSSCSNSQDRARNGLVLNNRVVNNSTANLGGNPWYQGSPSAGGIYVDGGVNIIIDGNFVTENDLGIEIASEAAGEVTEDVIVRNNVIFKNREVGIVLGGYNSNADQSGGGGVNRVFVYNNSFYKNRGWGTDITLQYRVANSQFYNNAIYASGAVSEGAESSISGDILRSDLLFKSNLWWGDGDVDSAPVNVTALVSDPLYTDPDNGDLTARQGSPLIDAGDETPSILNWTDPFWVTIFAPNGDISSHGTTDFEGNSRKVTTIDIGAYEK